MTIQNLQYTAAPKSISDSLKKLMIENEYVGIVLTEGTTERLKTDSTIMVEGLDSDEQPFPKPCINVFEDDTLSLESTDNEITDEMIESVVDKFVEQTSEMMIVDMDGQQYIGYLTDDNFGLISFLTKDQAIETIENGLELQSLDEDELEEYENNEYFEEMFNDGFNQLWEIVGNAYYEDLDYQENTELPPVAITIDNESNTISIDEREELELDMDDLELPENQL